MLRLALLTVGAWTVVSFLFIWAWSTAISRLSDPAGYDSPADPLAAARENAGGARAASPEAYAAQNPAASGSLEKPQHVEARGRDKSNAA